MSLGMFTLFACGPAEEKKQPTAHSPSVVRSEWTFPQGLRLPNYVWDKNNQNALVFVHGIWGNGKDTWLHPSGVYWPALVAALVATGQDPFGRFDIYVYDYASPLRGDTISIPDVVTDLRTRLKADRIFEKHKQVGFVVHSMGGLITRSFMLRYRTYAQQIPMIYFFATPTTGSIQANRVIEPIRTLKLDGMRTSDVNSFLQAQQGDWLAARFGTRSYCAFETQDIVRLRIVSRESASALCSEPPLPVPGNHSQVVKPEGERALQHAALEIAIRESFGERTSEGTASPRDSRDTSLERRSGESGAKGPPSAERKTPDGYTSAIIRFENTFQDMVSIYWIDPDGRERLYRQLGPRETYSAFTYVGHSWRVRKTDGHALRTIVVENRVDDQLVVLGPQ